MRYDEQIVPSRAIIQPVGPALARKRRVTLQRAAGRAGFALSLSVDGTALLTFGIIGPRHRAPRLPTELAPAAAPGGRGDEPSAVEAAS